MKNAINNKITEKDKRDLYKRLASCLTSKKFKEFKQIVEGTIEFDIEMRKIPNRFKIITDLLLDYFEEFSEGYQTSSLGKLIEILRFCNEINLLNRDLTQEDLELIEPLKKDELLLSNLMDLFGEVSDSFIIYIVKAIPQGLYEFFLNDSYIFHTDMDQLVQSFKFDFFKQYSIYGMSLRYLSSVEDFIREFRENYLNYKNKITDKGDREFFEFETRYKYQIYYFDIDKFSEKTIIKKHLVAPKSILKNMDKILANNNCNFYPLSMVLSGGLGSQGLGFTYSTPKGEVIELCNNAEENEAAIISYKQFLRTLFFKRLREEMTDKNIEVDIIQNIINYLSEIIKKKRFIKKSGRISKQVNNFLGKNLSSYYQDELELSNLSERIAKALIIILTPINMEDQFKTRMELVLKGKMNTEDAAKLTSVGEKSHYDILRERIYFQYLMDWFYDLYTSKKQENS